MVWTDNFTNFSDREDEDVVTIKTRKSSSKSVTKMEYSYGDHFIRHNSDEKDSIKVSHSRVESLSLKDIINEIIDAKTMALSQGKYYIHILNIKYFKY